MTTRRAGMDHAFYDYSPIGARPRLAWPNQAAVAANVVLHFEYWELDPPEGAYVDPRYRDPIAHLFPQYRLYTWREYGNRVGIFRILDLLDRLKLPVTVAANTAACERFTFLVKEFLGRGYEFAGHGTHATRMITSRMTEAEERAFIATSLDGIERATGRRAMGWVGQDYGETSRTPHLLAEAGLDYVIDWPNDDQPYAMKLGKPLISIPAHAEWDDVQALWNRKIPSQRYPDLVVEALQTLRAEGEASGRYFGLHIHPWLSGKPHRFPYLERALESLVAIDRVWWTKVGDVARAFAGPA
jgi:peptidoglycan/xylan/chitin deacetylase (PgdA/CDA1 family)